MENKHIDFEDMIELIYASEITPQTAVLAHKVNSHIIRCEECRHTYEVILKIYDRFQQSEAFYQNISLYGNKWIELVSLCIRRNTEILMHNVNYFGMQNAYRFSYPMAVGVRSGMENEKGKKNILVDEENSYNRIEYINDKLLIQLDKEDIQRENATLCILDEKNDVIFMEQMVQCDDLLKKELALETDKTYRILVI